ncbi:MAG TPA: CoA-binding protein [Deinococcales bacterium]|nr:CoA-binding protein [Deinococcales bacterium]
MNQAIRDFTQCKRLAVVGVSRGGKKFGNAILTELKARGFETYPVHPEAGDINGEKCYPDLAAVAAMADGVIVCVKPLTAVNVVREAAAVGIKQVWLQQGAQSPEAVAAGQELGVNVVAGRCILMYLGEVRSFHAFHRGFERLIGRY